MDAGTLAVLTDSERLLIEETSRESLAQLDEDEAIALEGRVRQARNKYVSQYRRAATAKVAEHGGRGTARPRNALARRKAEAFERALAQVSRRVAALARQSAAGLRAERLEQARAARQARWPRSQEMVPRQARRGSSPEKHRTGDRALRNATSERVRSDTLSQGARRQAARDTRRAVAR